MVTLTPPGSASEYFDVSHDGNTLLAAVVNNATRPTDSDMTVGLVLVRRAGGAVTTTVLTTWFDGDPALSPDGSTAWWLTDGVLYRNTAGVTTAVTNRYGDEQTLLRFAVSPDGTKAAVMYAPSDSQPAFVLAGDMANGPGNGTAYFQRTFSTPQVVHQSSMNLAWLDDSTLLYGVHDSALHAEAATLTTGGGTPVALPFDTTGVYQIHQVNGLWWAWRDDGTVTKYATAATFADLATATWAARVDGEHTGYYSASATVPPAMTVAVNRAASVPHLLLSASAVVYGKRVVYDAWAEYLTALPGQTFAKDADEVAMGTLQYSYNGLVWRTLRTTTGATSVAWPGSTTRKGNGTTQVLVRNTWFRWVYRGDILTTAKVSPVRKVTVTPIITVAVARKGALRQVYGKVTRTGGTVVLYRYVGKKWVKIAAVRQTSKKTYSFGWRKLPRGSYKVVVLKDASWNAASKAFKI